MYSTGMANFRPGSMNSPSTSNALMCVCVYTTLTCVHTVTRTTCLTTPTNTQFERCGQTTTWFITGCLL